MSRTLLLTLIISIATHVAAAVYHGQQEDQQAEVAQGSIKAPISMTFSSVQQAAAQPEPVKEEPVKDTLEPVAKKPEPIKQPKPKKNVVKIAEPEPQPEKPDIKKEPEKVAEKKPEPPKKEVKPQDEAPAETQVVKTATEKTEVEGLSNEPVFVSKPAIRKSVPPKYPRIAQRRNQQGVVMLEVVVDSQGHAMNIKVLESSGFELLDQSAIEAVEDWQFEPQKRNNQLVASRVHIPVAFQLN